MLSQWFIMLPEILLLSFVITSGLVSRYNHETTPKTFFTLARVFLVIALFMTIVFYNKSAFPVLLHNTSLITLFKTCAYLLTIGWLYLSSKWFLNKNRPSGIFCNLVMLQLLNFDVLASSVSLLVTGIVVPLIFLGNYCLILRHWDIERVRSLAAKYCWTSLCFTLILWSSIAIIYSYTDSFNYIAVQQYLSSVPKNNFGIIIACGLLLSVFIFLLGLAPFHIWFINFIASGVLPICGFFTLIPPMFYLCALINLLKDCLLPLSDQLIPVVASFSLFSVIIGALSANGETNIRRLFGYLSLYCLGFGLTGLLDFSSVSIITVFAFMIIALLSFAGVYTVFLSLKSHSEYLSGIEDIRGFALSRPYMAASLMVFMFSFIGFAPTLGFLGYMSIINNLMHYGAWWRLGFLIIGVLLAAFACLAIIRAIYFDNRRQSYDRADKSIYICLFINMMVILLSLFNPDWLLHNAVIILGGN